MRLYLSHDEILLLNDWGRPIAHLLREHAVARRERGEKSRAPNALRQSQRATGPRTAPRSGSRLSRRYRIRHRSRRLDELYPDVVLRASSHKTQMLRWTPRQRAVSSPLISTARGGVIENHSLELELKCTGGLLSEPDSARDTENRCLLQLASTRPTPFTRRERLPIARASLRCTQVHRHRFALHCATLRVYDPIWRARTALSRCTERRLRLQQRPTLMCHAPHRRI